MRPDNEKLFAAAKEAVARLTPCDFALLLMGALEGDYDMSDELGDILFESGCDNMTSALFEYINGEGF